MAVETLAHKELRRLAVEAFVAAHYDVYCDGALELAWYEAHPAEAAAIVAALAGSGPFSSTESRSRLDALAKHEPFLSILGRVDCPCGEWNNTETFAAHLVRALAPQALRAEGGPQ